MGTSSGYGNKPEQDAYMAGQANSMLYVGEATQAERLRTMDKFIDAANEYNARLSHLQERMEAMVSRTVGPQAIAPPEGEEMKDREAMGSGERLRLKLRELGERIAELETGMGILEDFA